MIYRNEHIWLVLPEKRNVIKLLIIYFSGFPITKTFVAYNPTLVPVHFVLQVEGDGTERSMSFEDFSHLKDKCVVSQNPKEFYIFPSEGVVEAHGALTISVSVTFVFVYAECFLEKYIY